MLIKTRLIKAGVAPEVAQEVQDLMDGKTEPMDYKSVQAWAWTTYHEPSEVEQTLCAPNEILDGYGVEPIFDRHDRVRAEYINMGETYTPTLLYDTLKKAYRVTSFGDFVEQQHI